MTGSDSDYVTCRSYLDSSYHTYNVVGVSLVTFVDTDIISHVIFTMMLLYILHVVSDVIVC